MRISLLTAINLYFSISIFISSYIVFFFHSRGRASYMRIMVAISLGILIYTYGYMMEINSRVLRTSVFWNQVQYLAIPFINGLWLILVLNYSGRTTRYKSPLSALILLIPLLTFGLRLTNGWHHLYYRGYLLTESRGVSILSLQKGPWYYLHMGYTVVISIFVMYVLARAINGEERSHSRIKYIYLLIATLLPQITTVLLSSGFIDTGLDYTAFVMPLVLLLALSVIRRYDFLETASLARDHVFNSSAFGMFVVSGNGRIIDYNPEAKRIFQTFGVRASEQSLSAIRDQNQPFYQWLTEGADCCFEVDSDGRPQYWAGNRTSLTNRYNEDIGSVYTLREVTAEEERRRGLEMMATTDHLSRLFNRREFENRGNRALERARRDGREIALLMLDIDHFKAINDEYGHKAGDEVIVRLAPLIQDSFRGNDFPARIGGEEFAVLLVDIRNRQLAVERAEQFRRIVREATLIGAAPEKRITVSIGIAMYTPDMSLETLMSAADIQLYEAKQAGRDRVCIEPSVFDE